VQGPAGLLDVDAWPSVALLVPLAGSSPEGWCRVNDHDPHQQVLSELQAIRAALVSLAATAADLVKAQQKAKRQASRVTLYLEARKTARRRTRT
jgi:hypothetical protein